MGEDIIPFRIDIPEDQLEDLRERLRRTRWPEPETVAGWSQGTPLAYARSLCRYWLEDYDWRAAEARLNRFPQFRTAIDGLDIHFVHVRSPHEGALPLVMTHGWPGSVAEFGKVIGPLTDPVASGGDAADAFHVVCPSLPGFGFSGKPARPGWGTQRIADAWDQLMTRLGYQRYGAQGGDWGSRVAVCLGLQHPGHVAGIHLNMVYAFPDRPDAGDLTEREREALAALDYYRRWDSGYAAEQSTRPQTVGYGLVDSPAALCAWITEKFWSWGDGGPHLLGELQPAQHRAGAGPGRLLHLPEEDLPPVPPLGRAAVPGPALLERAGQGRSLRRVRAAGGVRQRSAGRLPGVPRRDSLRRAQAGAGGAPPR